MSRRAGGRAAVAGEPGPPGRLPGGPWPTGPWSSTGRGRRATACGWSGRPGCTSSGPASDHRRVRRRRLRGGPRPSSVVSSPPAGSEPCDRARRFAVTGGWPSGSVPRAGRPIGHPGSPRLSAHRARARAPTRCVTAPRAHDAWRPLVAHGRARALPRLRVRRTGRSRRLGRRGQPHRRRVAPLFSTTHTAPAPSPTAAATGAPRRRRPSRRPPPPTTAPAPTTTSPDIKAIGLPGRAAASGRGRLTTAPATARPWRTPWRPRPTAPTPSCTPSSPSRTSCSREDARQDLADGRVNPHLTRLLLAVTREHRVTVSVSWVVTGHSLCVHGGNVPPCEHSSVSMHVYGRAVNILDVDGEAVSERTARAAWELLRFLVALPADQRPNEIGVPWPIIGGLPGIFSDADHDHHLHVAFEPDGPAPELPCPTSCRPTPDMRHTPLSPVPGSTPALLVAADERARRRRLRVGGVGFATPAPRWVTPPSSTPPSPPTARPRGSSTTTAGSTRSRTGRRCSVTPRARPAWPCSPVRAATAS